MTASLSALSHPGDINGFDNENPEGSSDFVEGNPTVEPREDATAEAPQEKHPETNELLSPRKSLLCGTPGKKVYPPNTVRKFLPLVIFTITVAIITTSALLLTVPDNNESVEQNSDPVNITKTDAAKRCQHELRRAFLGIEAFRLSADAPQSMATEWMAVEDNACEAELNVTRLEQRYALLAIYFGMNLNPTSSSLIVPGTHECDWENVGCDSAKQVTEIDLIRATGTIVEEIALLSSLTSLSTHESSVDGTIPGVLFSLSNLVRLELGGNNLQGGVSSEFERLSNLESVNLMANPLTGTLPDSFSSLTKLTKLVLDSTLLGGNMMSIICKLPKMVAMSVSTTKVTGTIPTEIGVLAHLESLSFLITSITGTIPSEIGLLTSLTRLDGVQTKLQGKLPSEIGHVRSLEILRLSDCDLSGTIPTEIGLCTMLTDLGIAGNAFSGTVPSELGSLTSLLVIDAAQNAFTGTLPSEMGMLSQVTSFNFGRNERMSGTVPEGLCAVADKWVTLQDCACCS